MTDNLSNGYCNADKSYIYPLGFFLRVLPVLWIPIRVPGSVVLLTPDPNPSFFRIPDPTRSYF